MPHRDEFSSCVAPDNGGIQCLPIVDKVFVEQAAHLLPQRGFAVQFTEGGLEKWAASFLYLVDQEGEHHQGGEHRGQVFLAMTVIMLKVITQVFKGVKRLVLHFPAGTPSRTISATLSAVRGMSVTQA